MNPANKNIKPGIGLGSIKFGMSQAAILGLFGEPDEKEREVDPIPSESWHYDAHEFSLAFDELEDWRLVAISVTGKGYEMDGRSLIGSSQAQLLEFLEDLAVDDFEMDVFDEEEEDQPTSISSEELGIIFWLEGGTVTEIQWGPLFLDEDTILWPE